MMTDNDIAEVKVLRVLMDVAIPETEAWEARLKTPISHDSRLFIAKTEMVKFQAAFVESDFLRQCEASETSTYFILSMSIASLLRVTHSATPKAVAHSTVKRQLITVPLALFEDTVLKSSRADEYRQVQKSEDRQGHQIMGIVNILLGSSRILHVLFLRRKGEDASNMSRQDLLRLFQHQFPGHPNPSDEKLDSVMRELSVSRTREQAEAYQKETRAKCPEMYAKMEQLRKDTALLLMRTCSWCHSRGVKLDVCSGCEAVWYCNTECQRAHWRKGHKQECASIKK